MSDLLYIRTLQHDTEDQIRISAAYPVDDLGKAEQSIIAGYEKDTAWCGGFKVACDRYYKRIAIVDAKTLTILRIIYDKREIHNGIPLCDKAKAILKAGWNIYLNEKGKIVTYYEHKNGMDFTSRVFDTIDQSFDFVFNGKEENNGKAD